MRTGSLTLHAPHLPPAGPELDSAQRRAVEHPVDGGHLMVVGAPGTGKTTTAVAVFERRLRDAPLEGGAEPALLLAQSRRAAERLRAAVSARLRRTAGQILVRTPASFAFSVLRSRSALIGDPSPTLISGPEQDAILAELLAGHREGAGAAPRWPSHLPVEALRLRAFRAELRDLLMRAAEAGLDADSLERLGLASSHPEWVAASAVLREYEQVLRLGQLTPDRGDRFDTALIIDAAVDALRHWLRDLPGSRVPRFRTVIVDDHQDSTLATARLLRALVDDGAQLVLFGDADTGVHGFRGGTPSLVRDATSSLGAQGGFGARQLVLSTVWRQTPELRSVTVAVTERIGAAGGAAHRAASSAWRRPGRPSAAGGGNGPSGIETGVVRTRAQEAALVARMLREEHLYHGTDYADMAVVVRGAAQAGPLRRQIAAAGVPVALGAADAALRDAPAVRPILLAIRAGLTAGLTAEDATDLLTSSLAGEDRLDAVSMRSLRRALRAVAAPDDAQRRIEELLVATLAEPARCALLPAPVRGAPRRVADVLAAVRSAARDEGATPETVLWAAWSAADLAETWRRAALAGGTAGQAADRDLDDVLALFRAAEQFTERNPAAGVLAFVDFLDGQDIPADTLAARGVRAGAVQVLTAAAAAGEEWDVVAVAGVQEGVWPDLRIRDSLLGAHELAERAVGREAGAAPDVRSARHDVLQDELRLFAVAVSRARRRLLVTAVRDSELLPSPFLGVVASTATSSVTDEWASLEDERPGYRPVAPPLDLRGLVARLRAELPDGPDAAAAARLLAELDARAVPGADPAWWAGSLEDSTEAPLWGVGETVELTPSAVERAQACPLRWALERAGGGRPSTRQQELGTLIHAVAADHPHGTAEVLAGELDRRWPLLGLGEGWVARTLRADAEAMIRRLARYLATRPASVDVERGFEVDLPDIRVRGRIDRVEHEPDGSLRIVDLKTGRTPKGDVSADPQLGAYQVAVTKGALGEGLRPAGASLVYLGAPTQDAALRHQVALSTDWAEAMLADVAAAVAGGTFTATVGEACRSCPVTTSCPAHSDGGRVGR